MRNQSSPQNFPRWFDPRHRSMSTWGFILNRVTAIGLTVYLFMHLVMLGQLAQGAEAYNNFIEWAHNPFIMFGELLVIAGGLIHGLNGIRIALTSFGVATRIQKPLLAGLMIIAITGSAVFAYKMFFG